MTQEKSAQKAESSEMEKRRSDRVVLTVPVEISWTTKDQKSMKVEAQSDVVNAHGALLRLKNVPPIGEVDIKHGNSGVTAQGRVVRVQGRGADGMARAAVEFSVRNESFWGLPYRVQRAISELKRLEQALDSRTEDVDNRVVGELRRSAHHVGRVAWALRQWIDLQAAGRDPYVVLSILAAERVSIVGHLSRDLSTDLDSAEVSFETEGLRETYKAVEQLHSRMATLFK